MPRKAKAAPKPRPRWKDKYLPEHPQEDRKDIAILQILESLDCGAPFGDACRAAGVDRSTFWRWVQEDVDLAQCRKAAESRGIVTACLALRSAIKAVHKNPKLWTAPMTFLERRRNEFKKSVDVRTIDRTLAELLAEGDAAMGIPPTGDGPDVPLIDPRGGNGEGPEPS